MDSCAYLQMPPPKKKSSSPPYHQCYNLFLVPAPVASRLQCSWLPAFYFVSSLWQYLVRLRPITKQVGLMRTYRALRQELLKNRDIVLQFTFTSKPRCRALYGMSASEVEGKGAHLQLQSPSHEPQVAIAIKGELQNRLRLADEKSPLGVNSVRSVRQATYLSRRRTAGEGGLSPVFAS